LKLQYDILELLGEVLSTAKQLEVAEKLDKIATLLIKAV
jgi:hypothetical protein